MSSPGENEQPRANVTPADRLEWQTELDSAMSDLDIRLRHPRRRASDVAVPQPTLPELGQLDVTNELLDEITWRVTEHIRRTQTTIAGTAPVALVPPVAPADMPAGAALVIRLRKPLFSWKFWRRRSRRRQSLMTFSDYRVT